MSIKKYGEYALVTGASSGIGREFAKALAKEGMNLVLVARRKKELELLAQELRERTEVEVIIYSIDLTLPDAVEKIASFTQNINIGAVILNAGMQTHGSFTKTSLQEQDKLLELNVKVPMKMAHIFAKRFVEKGSGALVFLASTFAYQAVPYFSNYAASKSYILNFAEALHVELAPKGVDVLALSPGLTKTEMPDKIAMDFSKMPISVMESDQVVQTALSALKKRKSSVIPGGRNKMMAFMAQRMMPRAAIAAMFGDMNAKAMDADVL